MTRCFDSSARNTVFVFGSITLSHFSKSLSLWLLSDVYNQLSSMGVAHSSVLTSDVSNMHQQASGQVCA